jgi:predicted TIM-barrel fold metal-dependent hydrolase
MRCDSHIHIVGPPDRYPQVPERRYLAGIAALDTLRRFGADRGVSRFVVVQPSFYGTDNSATLEALDALGDDGRGVAVIDPAGTPDEVLADFARRGVRGLRINLYSPLDRPGSDSLDAEYGATAQVAARMGWHVQVIAPLNILLRGADLLARSAAPVVVDHYGLYGRARPDGAEGERLMELLNLPHVWIKLSAPYRSSSDPLQTQPDREWLSAIVATAPERCVWGSDWPFTPPHDQQKGAAIEAPYRTISYRSMIDDFLAAVAAPDLAERILRDNPARLYGFPDGNSAQKQ